MALAAAGFCVGAAAYGATRASIAGRLTFARPLRPKLIERPARVTISTVASFVFEQPGRPTARAARGNSITFECRVDGGAWEACETPVDLTEMAIGPHRFAVRAVNEGGVRGLATRAGWRVRFAGGSRITQPWPKAPAPGAIRPTEPSRPMPVPPSPEPKPEPEPEPPEGPPFTIEMTGELGDLYPGAPAQELALLITNPNPKPISVVDLEVRIADAPTDCPGADNFIVTPATVSEATPLEVPTESAAAVPSGEITGPTIAMRDLPYSQDACQGAELPLELTGRAVE